MKIRTDFVTNSSSSSFLIEVDRMATELDILQAMENELQLSEVDVKILKEEILEKDFKIPAKEKRRIYGESPAISEEAIRILNIMYPGDEHSEICADHIEVILQGVLKIRNNPDKKYFITNEMDGILTFSYEV